MNSKPSLRVQSVLFKNEPGEIRRAFEAACGSLGYAGSVISRWVIAYGDSSPSPVLDELAVSELAAAARERGGDFQYSFFGRNLGHGGGHNRLNETNTEDLLMILNPDGVLAPDTTERLVKAMTKDTGVIDARQLPLEHPKEYDPVTGEASWSSLACALTPSEIFSRVGGIDHNTFFMYCDDVDYSWRVRLAGYKAQYCPQARMFHDKRLDPRGNFVAGDSEKYYSAEAALLLAYKYSRGDIVRDLRIAMSASSDPNALKAVKEFDRRQSEGLLPSQIDTEHSVAEFTRGTYGQHRF